MAKPEDVVNDLDPAATPVRLPNTFEFVRVTKSTPKQLIDGASCLLHNQWPRGGSPEQYRHSILLSESSEQQGDTAVKHQKSPLPCSFLLVLRKHCTVVAHGRLTECFDSMGAGSATAATYVVVDPRFRGQGWGTQLMAQLESESQQIGYHYVFLWTHTAVTFYQRLGYTECDRVSLNRSCLKSLESQQVSGLEDMLSRRLTTSASSPMRMRTTETIVLPPDEFSQGCKTDVWLRKRLVEFVELVQISLEERLSEMRKYIINFSPINGTHHLSWSYVLVQLSWQRQIGPSCGLAALRMVRELSHRHVEGLTDDVSLLQYARAQGMSRDGEIYDADDLAAILINKYSLDNSDIHVRSFPCANEMLKHLEHGGVFIVPYDSRAGTRLPCLNSGRSAHWGVVVGMLLGRQSSDNNHGASSLQRRSGDNDVAFMESVLLVQQGLSRELSIAPWSDFYDSNQQLVSVNSTKGWVPHLNLLDRVVTVPPKRGSIPTDSETLSITCNVPIKGSIFRSEESPPNL